MAYTRSRTGRGRAKRAPHVAIQRARRSRFSGGSGARVRQVAGSDAAQDADAGRVHPRPVAYRSRGLAPFAQRPGTTAHRAGRHRSRLQTDLSLLPRDGESGVRTVEPYGLVSKQATWYLVARAPAGMRTYRISRMQNAVVLAVTFERPANFDLAAHWKSATAQLQQKREQFRTTLAVAADTAARLTIWCRVLPAPDARFATALPDGWTTLHVFFENAEDARFIVLGLAARVHVLAPISLRDQVMEEMRAVMSRPTVSL
jgi:WYL domain